MATTRLMVLHTGKGRSVVTVLGKTIDYVENLEKTEDEFCYPNGSMHSSRVEIKGSETLSPTICMKVLSPAKLTPPPPIRLDMIWRCL